TTTALWKTSSFTRHTTWLPHSSPSATSLSTAICAASRSKKKTHRLSMKQGRTQVHGYAISGVLTVVAEGLPEETSADLLPCMLSQKSRFNLRFWPKG